MRIGYDGKRAVQNFTGLGNYSRYVIDALSTNCKDNEYLLYIPRDRMNPLLDEVMERGEGRVRKLQPVGSIWRFFSSLWRLVGVTYNARADRVDIYHGLSNELPLNIKGRVKSVVTVHDLIFLKLPHCYPVIDRHIYNFKFRRACKNANHIIAVSECTKRDIVKHYGISPGKISVIYQGCSDVFSKPVSKEMCASVKEKYNLPDRYVLQVGTIEERKNLLTVVKALKKLPQDVHLVAVGRRTKYTELVDGYIARKGLGDRVHILSDVTSEELPVIYRCAKTFVYMSLYEGFGIPILEALNSGLPVVAATGSCLEEAGGPHSLYVAPNDFKGLANAIMQCSIPEVRNEMIAEGYKWAARFTPANHAEQTMKCYRKILDE